MNGLLFNGSDYVQYAHCAYQQHSFTRHFNGIQISDLLAI